jgi:adenosylcobinamide-GDP ribazoletransferase
VTVNVLRHYLAALGFLTRLGPAAADPDMAASVPFFSAVGATLGLVLTVPLALGLFAGHPLAGAWFFAVANLALTRGLHLDGFADVADAWGSLACGERFFAIMKDSRVGAFGGMALVVAVTGQICLGASLFADGRIWLLAVSPAMGRAGAVVLMRVCRDLARPGLGALCLPGATARNTAIAVAVALAMGIALAGPAATAWACILCGATLVPLIRLARKNGGVNGDFIGAAIVGCELATLAGGLL